MACLIVQLTYDFFNIHTTFLPLLYLSFLIREDLLACEYLWGLLTVAYVGRSKEDSFFGQGEFFFGDSLDVFLVDGCCLSGKRENEVELRRL